MTWEGPWLLCDFAVMAVLRKHTSFKKQSPEDLHLRGLFN
jgi:hypothetical protein